MLAMSYALSAVKLLGATSAGALLSYAGFIWLLTIPTIQDHVIYLHKVTLTWFQDVNIPEQWGFLKNQVTPFYLSTSDNERLHAWHILPLDTYLAHEQALREAPSGLCTNIQDSLALKLLKDDANAQLVIYLHGAAGTLGSGWRPQSYRALSAAASNTHVLAVDYRGFGLSSGWPSEAGLVKDALALIRFAVEEARVTPDRIVIFAQSIGTAVALSVTEQLALQEPPVLFSGTVLVAPFADAASLTTTYKLGGTIPLLSPLASMPSLLAKLHTFLVSKWPSQERLASIVRSLDSSKLAGGERLYDITIIHAEDDYDIPYSHSDVLFWRAVNAVLSEESSMTFEQLEEWKASKKAPLGAAGYEVEWKGRRGIIREQIAKHGLHDRIMSYPIVSLAVARAFRSRPSS